ncbi:hypothetical protein COCCU_10845 [Corynebacterium occultum]|uniref:DUF732 domain-containing protein n=1 Tax=Corynebacterium occultum TaxID=2675219 RepID=A0A6B8WB78_9CORY|nr:hypothetical protein [Corynebacterium occultum]QGU08086.1 hypothetical protein COCCU_10845 [Corynebacterium occultum]
MRKIDKFLAAALLTVTLTSCAAPADSSTPAMTTPSTALAFPSAPGDTIADSFDPVGDGGITRDQEAAAAAILNRFPGTQVASLSPEEIARAGWLACVLAGQDNPDLYDPAVLKESMRQAYIWSGSEQDARVVPALVEYFCPDLYRGDAVVDELIDQLTH